MIKSVCCMGSTPAMTYVRQHLKKNDFKITDAPQWDTGHLLLDVPSFRPGSPLSEDKNLHTLLNALPGDTIIWGGNLNHPGLGDFRTVDLLKDEQYLAENAAITAYCTLQIAAPLLASTWQDTPTLIIGWGRIGKCLSRLLRSLDCPVAVSARSEKDLATLASLGYPCIPTCDLPLHLKEYKLICNTVPQPILSEEDLSQCQNCVKIDLASQKGLSSDDVVWARGLPGIHAPESSGMLIAKTFLRLLKEVRS